MQIGEPIKGLVNSIDPNQQSNIEKLWAAEVNC